MTAAFYATLAGLGFLATTAWADSLPQDLSAPVRVTIEDPEPGSVIRNRTNMAALSGIARAGDRPVNFDVIFVLDVSGSTKYPSGIDVDGDGTVGETRASFVPGVDIKNTDPEDSILAAEVNAARSMIQGLNPERVHVGLITFSGEVDPRTYEQKSVDQANAWLEQALTSEYARVDAALQAVALRQPSGGTDMQAGIKLAVRELGGLVGALSKPRRDSKKVILLLTDGRPSFPAGKSDVEDPDDIEMTIDAARTAKAGNIMINVYGLGPQAIDYPIAVTQVTRTTGGLYTPVRRPGDIVALLSGISFANIDDVVAVNLTIGDLAAPEDILLQPDGSFRGFVPVRPGKNRIRVSALASDGTRGSTEIDIVFKHQDLTDAELEAELGRIRKRKKELQLLMERDRQEAFRQQERERALTIEVEGEEKEQ